MNRLNIFYGYYILGLVMFLLAAANNLFQNVYVVLFFWANFQLVFTFGPPPAEDPEHSTITHYQRYSRQNWFNYAIAFFMVVSVLMVVFLPISRHLSGLILWSIELISLFTWAELWLRRLKVDLLTSYMRSQSIDLAANTLDQINTSLLDKPESTADSLVDFFHISRRDAEKIVHFFRVYRENNRI